MTTDMPSPDQPDTDQQLIQELKLSCNEHFNHLSVAFDHI